MIEKYFMNFNLKTVQKFIFHLITWGEISSFELKNMAGTQDWLPLFESAGVVCPVSIDNGSNAWSLSPELWSLFETEPEKALRTALFQIPEYRKYLISVLAEGITSAAKQELYERVESWSGKELLPFLTDINHILDKIETNSYRLINSTNAEIIKRFNLFRKVEFSDSSLLTPDFLTNCNQLLLGRSARPQDLFDFVLKRFVPYATPELVKTQGCTPAILPVITLQDSDGNTQFMNITPAPWNIIRADVQSSIALFDENGKPLHNFCSADQCKVALQDALIEQPFYKIVIQLAINHYRAKTASSPSFELYLRPGAELNEVEIFYETKRIGFLKEWLPVFIRCLKCFVARPLKDEQVGNMLENLLALKILDLSDDSIVLHSDFQSTLMASRLRSVFRPGKSLQERMVERIKNKGVRS